MALRMSPSVLGRQIVPGHRRGVVQLALRPRALPSAVDVAPVITCKQRRRRTHARGRGTAAPEYKRDEEMEVFVTQPVMQAQQVTQPLPQPVMEAQQVTQPQPFVDPLQEFEEFEDGDDRELYDALMETSNLLMENIFEDIKQLLTDDPELDIFDMDTLEPNEHLALIVSKHLPQMTHFFTDFLRHAEQKHMEAGNADVAFIISAIRSEIDTQLITHVPSTVQVIEQLARATGERRRRAILLTAINGGNGTDIPACTAEDVLQAATSFIDDMENDDHIHDWRLLYKLANVREIVRREASGDFQSALPAQHGSAPELALIKDLMPVICPNERRALIMSSFEKSKAKDLKNKSEKSKNKGFGQTTREERRRKSTKGSKNKDAVRPGRFFDSLVLVRYKLEHDEQDTAKVRLRLREIHKTAYDTFNELSQS